MTSTPGQPPVAIRVVAMLFLIHATLAVVTMAVGLFQLRIELDLWVLGFWIAPGLLRGSRTWRGWAVVFCVIDVLGAAVGSAAVIAGYPLRASILHVQLSDAPRWLWLVMALPWGLVSAWQLWVLTRPATRAWFSSGDPSVGQVSQLPA